MNLGIQDISTYIKSDTSGILWLTDEPLNYKTVGVYEFNYLLDGVIMKTISDQSIDSEKANFFLGKNFGKPLFIAHVFFEEKKDFNLIKNHFDVAQSFIKEGETVYIFNKSKNTAQINVLKELNSKYKNYNFEILNL